MVMGDAAGAAISAMVNCFESCIRWALLIRAGVISGLRPRARGGGQAGDGALLDQGGLVLGHEGEHAEDEFALGGGGVDDAAGQRLDADATGLEDGDDVDQVT